MLKAALILAAQAAALGLATLAVAQDAAQDSGDDELYYSINEDPGPWFLQRSTCTLAHNVTGNAIAVVRFRISMGVEIEFLDPALLRVRPGETAPFVVAVDGATEEGVGIGVDEGDRRGYLLSVSHEMLNRIAAGRRLEAATRGRTLLRLDLAGAAAAVDAMRACRQAMLADMPSSDMNVSAADAMEDAADALRNEAAPEAMSSPNAM